jgi:uncharacterized protein
MTGRVGAHTNRPELVAVHGYDTKYAMHALRLGLQGVELLTTGRITLPVPEPHRAYLRSIRRGERPLAEVLHAVSDAESRLAGLQDSSALPEQPDRRWVDDWLYRSYTAGPPLGRRLAAPQLHGLLVPWPLTAAARINRRCGPSRSAARWTS